MSQLEDEGSSERLSDLATLEKQMASRKPPPKTDTRLSRRKPSLFQRLKRRIKNRKRGKFIDKSRLKLKVSKPKPPIPRHVKRRAKQLRKIMPRFRK